jgi:hypothetical protein
MPLRLFVMLVPSWSVAQMCWKGRLTMVIQGAKRKAQDLIGEIKQLVLQRFPDAEFEVRRIDRKNYRIEVIADFENMFDILDLTSDRATDILVDHDIYIGVTPTPRNELTRTQASR